MHQSPRSLYRKIQQRTSHLTPTLPYPLLTAEPQVGLVVEIVVRVAVAWVVVGIVAWVVVVAFAVVVFVDIVV